MSYSHKGQLATNKNNRMLGYMYIIQFRVWAGIKYNCTHCTQEIESFPMWLVTSYIEPLVLCQLCVGPRPGSNCPIPALSLLVKASPVWLDKPCLGCFPLGPSSLGKHCLQCEWGSLSRCRSAQLYYKPSFTGTCTAEKENPTVMALAPRFDRGLSVVRIFSNLS